MAIDMIENDDQLAHSQVDGFGYHNIFGVWEGKQKEPERYEETLANWRKWVPLPGNITCRQIEKNISNMENEVQKLMSENSGNVTSSRRTTNERNMRALNQHIGDHKARFIKMECALQQEQRETNDWINKTEDVLGRQENTILGTSNMNKYLIYGLAGVVAIAGIYFIVK